jgi:hypothetical protein
VEKTQRIVGHLGGEKVVQSHCIVGHLSGEKAVTVGQLGGEKAAHRRTLRWRKGSAKRYT